MQIIKSNIALTVKDGSKAFFKDVHLEKNNFDVALFNKKNEFSYNTPPSDMTYRE